MDKLPRMSSRKVIMRCKCYLESWSELGVSGNEEGNERNQRAIEMFGRDPCLYRQLFLNFQNLFFAKGSLDLYFCLNNATLPGSKTKSTRMINRQTSIHWRSRLSVAIATMNCISTLRDVVVADMYAIAAEYVVRSRQCWKNTWGTSHDVFSSCLSVNTAFATRRISFRPFVQKILLPIIFIFIFVFFIFLYFSLFVDFILFSLLV